MAIAQIASSVVPYTFRCPVLQGACSFPISKMSYSHDCEIYMNDKFMSKPFASFGFCRRFGPFWSWNVFENHQKRLYKVERWLKTVSSFFLLAFRLEMWRDKRSHWFDETRGNGDIFKALNYMAAFTGPRDVLRKRSIWGFDAIDCLAEFFFFTRERLPVSSIPNFHLCW